MADYDRRNGGGRQNFNSKKRRYRDEDDYDRRPQRRKYEEPLAVKVRKQLLSIAESPIRRPEEDVAEIAKTVAENYEDEELRIGFVDLVIQLVAEQPLKIPFAAAVVLALNPLRPNLAEEILRSAGQTTQGHLERGSWREVKLLLRFLGCLQELYDGEGIFIILDELFLRAVDLQVASPEDSLGLELVKIILLTLPYVMASPTSGLESQASALLEKTAIIALTQHSLEALVDPYPAIDQEKPQGSNMFIGLLQKQLQDEAESGWALACLPRPWKISPEKAEEDPEGVVSKHKFPALTIPSPVKTGARVILPEIYLSVYSAQEIQTVPPTSSIASSLIRDTLVDVINLLDFNRNATAKFLIDVDCYFAPDTFVKRATAFDKLRDAVGDRSTWKPEDVAVDAVFSQMFQLPVAEHKLIYYHSVLTESCKLAPAAIAPSLGRAIRYLYQNIEHMDLDLRNRFLDWFAHHLSNFGFTWKWTEWVDDIALPDVHPRKAFIMGALDKEVRLSFAPRIRGTLPEPYQPLISTELDKDIPDFKYRSEDTPFAKEAKEIVQAIRGKGGQEDMQIIIDSIESQAASHGVEEPLLPSTDAFVTSICFVGAKSLSHFLSCIERCKDRLLSLGPRSSVARHQIITSVMDYWKYNPGIGVNIIDKLLNYTILTPMSVVEWALRDQVESGQILSRHYVYEMVSTTIGKVTNRVRQVLAATRHPGLPEDQVKMLSDTLDLERQAMRDLFKVIEDALVSIADGSSDGQMDEGEGDTSEEKLVQGWGQRWLRVFQRRMAVEEAFITEVLATKPDAKVEPEDKAEGDGDGNGNGNGNPNGTETEHGNGAMDDEIS